MVVQYAHENAAENINRDNNEPGDRVAAHELTRAVHRAEKVRLFRQLFAHAARLVRRDAFRVEIEIDRRLATRQGVEREPRAHLANTRRPFGDHDELDHDKD